MGETTYERSRAAAVVAGTEPFFRDVMEVYIDLLTRGEREASRLLFRSAVRFAAAVHGLQRASADRTRVVDASGEAGGPGSGGTRPQPDAVRRAAAGTRRHLEGCLYALWLAQQRRGELSGAGPDTGPLFEQGLAMLAALRGLSSPPGDPSLAPENAPAVAAEKPVPPERTGREELRTWIRETTSSPPSR